MTSLRICKLTSFLILQSYRNYDVALASLISNLGLNFVHTLVTLLLFSRLSSVGYPLDVSNLQPDTTVHSISNHLKHCSYDDNEPSTSNPPAPAPAAAAPPVAAAPSQPQPVADLPAQPDPVAAPTNLGPKIENNGYGDDYQEDTYDDDDDVDFNLGNDSGSTPVPPPPQQQQHDDSAPAYHQSGRGSSAKEDG